MQKGERRAKKVAKRKARKEEKRKKNFASAVFAPALARGERDDVAMARGRTMLRDSAIDPGIAALIRRSPERRQELLAFARPWSE